MKKLLLTTLLTVTAVSLSSCQTDWVAKHNPTNIMKDNYTMFRINYGGYEYHFGSGDTLIEDINNQIKNVGKFVNIRDNDTKSSKYFTYHVERSVLMWGSVRYIMHFYDDGYVSVQVDKHSEETRNLPDHYYYSFDASKAKTLYETVATYASEYEAKRAEEEKEIREEREKQAAAAKDAEDRLNAFTLDEALKQIKDKDSLKVSFFSNIEDKQLFDNDLEDDGTIKDLVVNASYTLTPEAGYREEGRYSRIYIDGVYQESYEIRPLFYSLFINEQTQYMNYSINTTDTYDKTYTMNTTYTMERNTIHTLFDNAIRLYTAKHGGSAEQR